MSSWRSGARTLRARRRQSAPRRSRSPGELGLSDPDVHPHLRRDHRRGMSISYAIWARSRERRPGAEHICVEDSQVNRHTVDRHRIGPLRGALGRRDRVLSPTLRAQVRLVEAGDSTSAGFKRLDARVTGFGIALGVIVFFILMMMVFKPHL